MDFPYGETEIAYLRAGDPKLGAAMDRIGYIPLLNGVFSSKNFKLLTAKSLKPPCLIKYLLSAAT